MRIELCGASVWMSLGHVGDRDGIGMLSKGDGDCRGTIKIDAKIVSRKLESERVIVWVSNRSSQMNGRCY